MGNRKREFVIKDLMVPGFVVQEGKEVLLAETEESGKRFALNFGECISFEHIPIKMERSMSGILTGRLKA